MNINKIFLFVLLTVASTLFSCNKNWSCTCQTSLLGETVQVEEMNGWKKNEAADACKMVEKAQSYENCVVSER